jgi:hypothetical protein
MVVVLFPSLPIASTARRGTTLQIYRNTGITTRLPLRTDPTASAWCGWRRISRGGTRGAGRGSRRCWCGWRRISRGGTHGAGRGSRRCWCGWHSGSRGWAGGPLPHPHGMHAPAVRAIPPQQVVMLRSGAVHIECPQRSWRPHPGGLMRGDTGDICGEPDEGIGEPR